MGVIESKKFLYIGVDQKKNCTTLLVKGCTTLFSSELTKNLKILIKAQLSEQKEFIMLAGGCAADVSLSLFLETASKIVKPSNYLLILIFSKALLTLVTHLSDNAGMDKNSTLFKLIFKHKSISNIGFAYGINLDRCIIADLTIEEKWESAIIKDHLISSCTEAANYILQAVKIKTNESGIVTK